MSVLRSFLGTTVMAIPLVTAAPAAGEQSVGTASDAQPGAHRIGVPEPAAPNLVGTFAYGLTEAQGDARGLHQRFALRLAGAAAVLPWLNVGAALDGRFDVHSHDSGAVLGGRVAARAFTEWHKLELGAELAGWVPGSEQLSTLVRSASVDARALLAARFAQSFVAFNAGYRFDRSAAAGANAALLSPGDRLALGVSDFDAVLLGIGGGVDVSGTELFGEASCDWLIGRGAPPFSQSPLRLAAGARRALSDAVSAELVLEALLSGRPQSGPPAPLVPREPRGALFVGATYRFDATRRGAALTNGTPAPTPDASKPAPPVAPPPAAVTSLELTVVDDTGAPLPGARAHVSVGTYERDIELDAAGHHREEQVPLGAGKIVVTAAGFETSERSLALAAGAPGELRAELKALPPPSQVRGFVRSFGGTGLAARIRIEPLGVAAATGEDGRFQIDVPPGGYDIVIEANGYVPQRRKITVDVQGVVIVNADLSKKK